MAGTNHHNSLHHYRFLSNHWILNNLLLIGAVTESELWGGSAWFDENQLTPEGKRTPAESVGIPTFKN